MFKVKTEPGVSDQAGVLDDVAQEPVPETFDEGDDDDVSETNSNIARYLQKTADWSTTKPREKEMSDSDVEMTKADEHPPSLDVVPEVANPEADTSGTGNVTDVEMRKGSKEQSLAESTPPSMLTMADLVRCLSCIYVIKPIFEFFLKGS